MPPRKPKSRKKRLRVSRVGGVVSRRWPRKAKSKQTYNGCPLKVTIECFSWPPITVTAQTLGLTLEQVEKYGIKPEHRLYWCSKCRCVYYLSNNFAYIIGKREVEGSDLIPGELRGGDISETVRRNQDHTQEVLARGCEDGTSLRHGRVPVRSATSDEKPASRQLRSVTFPAGLEIRTRQAGA